MLVNKAKVKETVNTGDGYENHLTNVTLPKDGGLKTKHGELEVTFAVTDIIQSPFQISVKR
jgi:hypothetical protein